MVAFIPFGQNEIGWVPLGPGDVYVPHYYNTSWQPHYLTRDNLYQRVVNLNVPGAVTVVSVDDFTRGFDWRRARRADRDMLASVNPVLDPLLVTPLRNAVVNSAWGRGKKDIPPGIARKLQDTTVITSTDVVAPPFRPDLARTMRVEKASDRAKGQQFKVRDERPGRGTPQAANAPAERGGGPPVERGGGAERGGPPAERGNAAAPAERRTGPPENADGVRVRIRDRQRHANSRGMIAVFPRHGPNDRCGRNSSDRRRNALRVQLPEWNVQLREWNVPGHSHSSERSRLHESSVQHDRLQRDRRPRLNDQRRLRKPNVHSHSRNSDNRRLHNRGSSSNNEL
jgi:hypothetical protein